MKWTKVTEEKEWIEVHYTMSTEEEDAVLNSIDNMYDEIQREIWKYIDGKKDFDFEQSCGSGEW